MARTISMLPLLRRLLRRSFLMVMMVGSLLITLSSLVYFDPDTLAPFVIEKLPVRFETLWLKSLSLHVASAMLTFPACLLLMTRFLQRRPVWHRWLGRITGVFVLGALVPSGIILSFDAKGGSFVTLGFLLSAGIILWAMVSGVAHARRGRLGLHARAMRHVVAQMSVAVTSRALLIALDLAGLNPDTAYAVALWVPVVASFVAAEWVSGRLSLHHLFPFNSLLRSQP